MRRLGTPVVLAPRDPKLQEGAVSGFTYSLVSPDPSTRGRRLCGVHPPFQCRDFFQDIWWAEYRRTPAQIYGLSWTPGTLDVTAEWFTMAVTYRDASMEPYAEPTEALLHAVEERIGFPRSELWLAETQHGPDTALVVEFHRRWTEKPMLLSAFTLLLRLGPKYQPPPESLLQQQRPPRTLYSYDGQYLTEARPRLQRLFRGDLAFAKKGWEDYRSVTLVHGYSGIAWGREE